MQKPLSLAIHGGAGALKPGTYSDSEMREYMSVLRSARIHGSKLLQSGKNAIDVCVEVIKILEDCPLFNAGIGSVYSSNERQEMDASLMDGEGLQVGGVSLLTRIKNPIEAARYVLKNCEHSLLAGVEAESFLHKEGFSLVDPEIFRSEKRLEQLYSAKKKGKAQLDHSEKMGTVGCCAIDQWGNLAAGTSTGGMTNKLPGRVSDSSIVGAGTWAENHVVAISGTGTGDQFIAGALAHELASLIKYKNLSLEKAAHETLRQLEVRGGSGGFALIDSEGNIELPFNSLGMFRAWWSSKGEEGEAVYR